MKISKSFARIHKANLINFGILPLVFENAADYDRLQLGDRLVLPDLRRRLLQGDEHLPLQVNGREYRVRVELSGRHRQIIAAGGLLNVAKKIEAACSLQRSVFDSRGGRRFAFPLQFKLSTTDIVI